jgi:5-methyltetrahydrofolate--homocysteine methyltransferase
LAAPESSAPTPADPGVENAPAAATTAAAVVTSIEPNDQRSAVVAEEPALVPPFWGSNVLTEQEIDLQEVFAYLDRSALFAGQWQLRKTQQQSRDDYEAMLADKAEPVLQHWMGRCLEEGLLSPRLAYGYFPCGRSPTGSPIGMVRIAAAALWQPLLHRRFLPRSIDRSRWLCIAN